MAVIRSQPARARRSGRMRLYWLWVAAFLVIGSVGGTMLGSLDLYALRVGLPETIGLPRLAPAVNVEVGARPFPLCAGTRRTNCVVDGDTFRLDATTIRIADINTPEVSSPHCDAEARLGRTATGRLRDLLSAGPFELGPADRDEDRYGRKLRVVLRDGRSIGDTLVAEGLAHHWRGYQENWC